MSDLVSRPYATDSKVTCYACVFGTPENHSPWCMHRWHDDCTCYLSVLEESRGEPHATECPRSKKRESHAA